MMSNENTYSFIQIGKRKTQQDALYISNDQKLLAVCDGVGGLLAGEKASQTIVNAIHSYYTDQNKIEDKNDLAQLVQYAQTKLNELVIDDKLLEGLSTTLALVYIGESQILIAYAGDTRIIYIARDNKSFQATKDHSLVRELRDADIIKSDTDMLLHPLRNRITKVLKGSYKADNNLQIDFQKIQNYSKGDLLLIASDGALESFTTKQIAHFFMDGEIEEKWESYKNHCETNSKDNNTCILKVL